MIIPHKVKILGHWYTVKYLSDSEHMYSKTGSLHGWTQNIGIQGGSDITSSQQEEVFFHEVLHALDFHLNLDLSEQQTNCISAGLYQVLVDNHLLKGE